MDDGGRAPVLMAFFSLTCASCHIGEALSKNPGYLKLRRIRAAQSIAKTIAASQNRVYLNSNSLVMNLQEDSFASHLAGGAGTASPDEHSRRPIRARDGAAGRRLPRRTYVPRPRASPSPPQSGFSALPPPPSARTRGRRCPPWRRPGPPEDAHRPGPRGHRSPRRPCSRPPPPSRARVAARLYPVTGPGRREKALPLRPPLLKSARTGTRRHRWRTRSRGAPGGLAGSRRLLTRRPHEPGRGSLHRTATAAPLGGPAAPAPLPLTSRPPRPGSLTPVGSGTLRHAPSPAWGPPRAPDSPADACLAADPHSLTREALTRDSR
ncbi:hypothetical protein NDU88_000854 [Pleurodeles waltl]|uniref:Uncharacterized protein n=1 Tax=Pleurodeles waltl TaxID=8319 RepID=A0AAV7P233_PLEWA|nr:hypothetical protein NDU88_000854 [Pleurodeles waltl]